ncbi:MAG TPA: hypothetical protein VL096_04015, partial [Pirellulaceae bacterium]|nr:hypothetical protein [Pirellulaceae bacterium]
MLTRWIELLLTALGVAIVCGSSAPPPGQFSPQPVRVAKDDDVALERILERLRQPPKGWEF